MKPLIVLLTASVIVAPGTARAEKYSFDVDPRFANITFESHMDIEDILGSTKTVAGSAELAGDRGRFRLEVPVASLRTGIDMRDEHLRSEAWLDAGRHPTIVLEGGGIRRLEGDRYELTGKLTVHGVTKPAKVVVEVRRIAAAEAKRLGLGDVPWVRIRSSFTVKLSDHGIRIPAMAAAKVNDAWTVSVSLFGKQVTR